MIIIVCIYNTQFSGNYSSDELDIPNGDLTVIKLKQILNKKYQIEPSLQRLTIKICNTLVTMTNEWPLSFFHIKTKSTVYLEQIQDNSNCIKNKIINKTKMKYMNQLTSPNDKSNTNTNTMSIITESPNEYHEDCLDSDKSYLRELVISVTKNNNIAQLKELIEQYNAQNLDALGNSGWNALHYASFFGYDEIAALLVIGNGCNPNVRNKEGWTCLHFAAFKGNHNIASLLISLDCIQPDVNVEIIGTPLHVACKNNYFKTVSVLLHKAKPNVMDSNGKYPKDLTTNPSIMKLLEKVLEKTQEAEMISKHNECLLNTSTHSNCSRRDKTQTITGYEFIEALDFKPPKPPKAIGFVQKEGRVLPVFRDRYIEVDPISGTMKRYKTIADFPNKPNEIISLSQIRSCRKTKVLLKTEDVFYFELICNSKELYRVDNLVACEKWVEVINSACNYAKFWHLLSQKYNKTSAYLVNQTTETIIIDSETGEIRVQGKNRNIYRLPRPNSLYYTQGKKEQDAKLVEDSTLLKGIKSESFEKLELLGSGTFGNVFKVKYINNGNIYAMKAINKANLQKKKLTQYAITECNILKQANNPFIIKLHFSFQTEDYLYMVLDYCEGGDLGSILREMTFEEEEAKFYIAELIIAIKYLHSKNVIYRDLKPDNILIDSEGHIKLADFNLSKENVNSNDNAKSFCGSPPYLSPEMLEKKGVGKAADIYGIGAIIYEMISGTPPFFSKDKETLYDNIQKNDLMLHEYFSEDLKHLLKSLLNKNPDERMGVNDNVEIKFHPWFDSIDWELLEQKKIKPPLDLCNFMKAVSYSDNYRRRKRVYEEKDKGGQLMNGETVKNFTFVRPQSPDKY